MPHWKPKSDVRATPVGEKLMLLSATMGRNQWMCYRLATELGDLMFHPPDRVKSVEEHPEFFFEPSRIKHIVLTHRGDYSAGAAKLAEDWGATFYAHRDELDALGVAGTAFTEDHAITPELEAICLPGHGAGYTCYLYRDQGTGYLL